LCNGAKLYANNKLITELVIPDTVKEIKAYALEGCESLTSVVIPDSVNLIGHYAFEGCHNLISVEISFSTNASSMPLGRGIFKDCPKLKRIDFSKMNYVPRLFYPLFDGIEPESYQIKVSANLIDEWKARWTSLADKIVTEFTN
jgi:hypothetical protein